MDNKKPGLLSRIFTSKAGKGAAGGAAVAFIAAAALPVITVSVPVLATGAVIGAIWNSMRNK